LFAVLQFRRLDVHLEVLYRRPTLPPSFELRQLCRPFLHRLEHLLGLGAAPASSSGSGIIQLFQVTFFGASHQKRKSDPFRFSSVLTK